mmetsp:Transcript_35801/g.95973  ORF Transcript_35801/g.95973 Transcript_35801/m.95973 type:complete len:152 (-) Transcript_35801:34-489(-)
MVGVASFFVLNRNGSLIYDLELQSTGSTLSSNDKIRLSSTFHGISAIASQVSPVRNRAGGAFSYLQPRGITSMDASTFRLQCFPTLTGMKFFCVALPPLQDCEPLLRQAYALYSDFVLKNPFYELDMPVRCELFDREMRKLLGDPLQAAGR